MNMNLPVANQPRTIDVETLEHFDRLVEHADRPPHLRSMHGWHLQSLDLTGRDEPLRRLDPVGSMFLGCVLTPGTEESLRRRGALVFPTIPGVPFNPYRAGLYASGELYGDLSAAPYEDSLDAQVYAWSQSTGATTTDINATLATALHDHAVSDALDGVVRRLDRKVVGVMGGHNLGRGTPGFLQAARLGRALTRAGHLVATGGGPGAMEAGNAGAYLSALDDDAFGREIEGLAEVPSFSPSIRDWALAAQRVLARHPEGGESLGIPTWFYGHEPPNLFATGIAKYFANSIREATLLNLCDGGVVFLPGAAGTVQEIFQNGCENYYSAEAAVTPMILVGVEHWTRTVPAWQLLSALGQGRPLGRHLHLVDSLDEAVGILARPRSYIPPGA